ncbi:leucine-rich repeat domain-containing protein [bacterium 0.1xD8-71]|nr:leucine-rich repeat domain-containing protein [bacterium 0.1xD8-71]
MSKYRMFILTACILCLLFGRSRMICCAGNIQQDKEQYLTYEINDNGEAVITGGNCDVLNSIVIPNTIDGYRVIGVADRAFAYRQDIHHLRVEEGVRNIGAYAFAGCRHMDTPSLGEGLQAIGEGAFRDNLFTGRVVSRWDVFLPDSIMSIDKEAFDCCSHLQYIRLPQYADIDSSAFEGTLWQEERDELFQIRGDCLLAINGNTDSVLNLPYGVTRLADEEGPKLLIDDVSRQMMYEEIVFPNTLTEIRGESLEGIRVSRIEVPGGVKYIPIGFLRYGKVSELVLSEGTEVIGPGAFSNIEGLETIRIPGSVLRIYDNAFAGCEDLRRITIPGTVEKVGENVFDWCENLTEVVYEEGIREIGCGYADTQIKCIQFPESTVRIHGSLAYAGNLERIYIPAGVAEVNDEIFSLREKYRDGPITVYGQKGSRAEQLAVQSGYKFIEVESGDEMP